MTLIKLGKGELLTQVERIAKMDGEEEEELDEDGNVIEAPESEAQASAEQPSEEQADKPADDQE